MITFFIGESMILDKCSAFDTCNIEYICIYFRNGDIVGVFVPYENLLEGPIVTSRFGFCFNENFKDFRKGDVIITIEGSNINPAGTKSFSEVRSLSYIFQSQSIFYR